MQEETFKEFKLESLEDVIRFEALMKSYQRFPLNHISLTDAYKRFQNRPDHKKIFTAVFDLMINFQFLFDEFALAHGIYGDYLAHLPTDATLFDSQLIFNKKMDMLRNISSFVFRYRAVWDKFMGVNVLIFAPKEYEAFISARRKLKTFKKLALKHRFLTEKDITTIEHLVNSFSNNFRTSEIHGAGILRKYILSMDSMIKNPQLQLIYYWNSLNRFISILGKNFIAPQSIKEKEPDKIS